MDGSQTRRGFFRGMFAGVGGVALVGCIDQADAPSWTGIVAPEPVELRPGVSYANVLPAQVPAVRQAP